MIALDFQEKGILTSASAASYFWGRGAGRGGGGVVSGSIAQTQGETEKCALLTILRGGDLNF